MNSDVSVRWKSGYRGIDSRFCNLSVHAEFGVVTIVVAVELHLCTAVNEAVGGVSTMWDDKTELARILETARERHTGAAQRRSETNLCVTTRGCDS